MNDNLEDIGLCKVGCLLNGIDKFKNLVADFSAMTTPPTKLCLRQKKQDLKFFT